MIGEKLELDGILLSSICIETLQHDLRDYAEKDRKIFAQAIPSPPNSVTQTQPIKNLEEAKNKISNVESKNEEFQICGDDINLNDFDALYKNKTLLI